MSRRIWKCVFDMTTLYIYISPERTNVSMNETLVIFLMQNRVEKVRRQEKEETRCHQVRLSMKKYLRKSSNQVMWLIICPKDYNKGQKRHISAEGMFFFLKYLHWVININVKLPIHSGALAICNKVIKIQVKQNQAVTTNPFIYCNVSSPDAPIFIQPIFL